jgi:hypothetical protein
LGANFLNQNTIQTNFKGVKMPLSASNSRISCLDSFNPPSKINTKQTQSSDEKVLETDWTAMAKEPAETNAAIDDLLNQHKILLENVDNLTRERNSLYYELSYLRNRLKD